MEAASARFHQGMPRPVALAMLLAAELRPMREQDFSTTPLCPRLLAICSCSFRNYCRGEIYSNLLTRPNVEASRHETRAVVPATHPLFGEQGMLFLNSLPDRDGLYRPKKDARCPEVIGF